MRDFIKRALKKLKKLTAEQTQELLVRAAAEIDRLETVLDSLAEGILVCDTQHSLVMANKYADRFLPLSHHEPSGGPIWRHINHDALRDFFQTTLKEGDRVEEREFDVDSKGIQRLLSISVLPLVRDHQVSGSLIYVEDITEKRKKEARLRRAENLASLTTLAAGVAHEIKNPLGSISIHIQLMQKALTANKDLFFQAQRQTGQDPAEYFNLLERYIGIVNEEIDRLNHIVVDFLFAVRPMNMELREGNLNALIEDLMAFVRYELEEARIECILCLGELPPIIFDERYMKQALLNLIKNAIAAMPDGGRLTVTTEPEDMAIRLVIQDTGVGISEENLSKIFEPYFTTKAAGSGLGLTLVFKIIREHRGEVTVKSKEGEGACFIITLPVPQRERRLIGYEG
ncbi:MAG: PAS domain S-box protein [Treponema sp.]|jgi:PAS domain S-box-containing protein|nr:PAS domain S-box protein [Treponema sp.]